MTTLKAGDFTFTDRILTFIGEGNPALAVERANYLAGRIAADYAGIAPYLPAEIPSILDIGCGLAGIDVLIARRHRTKEIHLLDGEGDRTKHRHGFHNEKQAWGDVAMGAAFARRNLGRAAKVVSQVAGAELPPMQVHLVISTLSWGHHYPVETYLDAVTQRLAPAGSLVIDIRYNRLEGRSTLEKAGFKFVAQVAEGRKHRRLVFTR